MKVGVHHGQIDEMVAWASISLNDLKSLVCMTLNDPVVTFDPKGNMSVAGLFFMLTDSTCS